MEPTRNEPAQHRKAGRDKPIVLIALGGHAFMLRGEKGTISEQERNAERICKQLQTVVDRDYNFVITHGNGPQVGHLLLLNETSDGGVPLMPLDVLVAETEGSLGYFMQQAMLNELRRRQIRRYVVTVITQVLVDPEDPAFKNPTKPVGPFLTQAEAERRRDEKGWQIVEDSGRGWRRLVPSPRPIKVVQRHMIRESANAGYIVIACGGGGIPIFKKPDGSYEGTEAVIDKDLSSSILANEIGADLFVILTEVPQVYVRYGKPDQAAIGAITSEQLMDLYRAGEFPAGSMGPKVEAVCGFLERGGKRAIITNPETLEDALRGRGGTHVIGAC
ncbi:MAG: carbamate kinase [Deltaproteobacteria bacterium]|nr:carbamate kinase [Deltaproteobacteria bacterium]